MKGVTTILDQKKWVFTYVVLIISFFKFDQAGMIQILVILIPGVFALAAADKYTKRIGDKDEQFTDH